MPKLRVNGQTHQVNVADDTPLLFVLRNDLQLNGPKFGCGMSQCGACTVIVDGQAIRSCVTAVGTVVGQEITTLEGIGTPEKPHPLQKAFLEEQAAQCGYCTNSMIMKAKTLLDSHPHPTEAQVRSAMDGHLCRCGAHNRIILAIMRAAHH
jgi:nicotinate dehydrogenase subunit A